MAETSQNDLYAALVQQLGRHLRAVQDDEQRGVLVFPPSEINQIGHALFARMRRGGFATVVVSGRQGWDPQSYYFESARMAARRGCEITRAFLLPHRQYLNDEVLQLHRRLDLDAGIDVKFLYVGDLLSELLVAPTSTLDFGIWDESIVCSVISQEVGAARGPSEWRVSCRPEDIEMANLVRDDLLSKAAQLPPSGPDSGTPDLEEPMVRTAPLMDLLATALCRGDYVSLEDCSWYHGVWQYLRIFDLVSTPTWHSQFYMDELTRLARERDNARILVSGTADYSVLAHVLWTFARAGRRCHVTVLDLCETPLILCRWYARQLEQDITTVRADILTYAPADKFDCITSDAFLTRFTPLQRPQLLDSWTALLKPGGRVITTVRIGGPAGTEREFARPEQVDVFRQRALLQATRWRDFLPITAEEIAIKAQRYAERMVSHPVASADELREAFLKRGYQTERFDTVEVKGEMVPTTYLEMTARKGTMA